MVAFLFYFPCVKFTGKKCLWWWERRAFGFLIWSPHHQNGKQRTRKKLKNVAVSKPPQSSRWSSRKMQATTSHQPPSPTACTMFICRYMIICLRRHPKNGTTSPLSLSLSQERSGKEREKEETTKKKSRHKVSCRTGWEKGNLAKAKPKHISYTSVTHLQQPPTALLAVSGPTKTASWTATHRNGKQSGGERPERGRRIHAMVNECFSRHRRARPKLEPLKCTRHSHFTYHHYHIILILIIAQTAVYHTTGENRKTSPLMPSRPTKPAK